MTERDLAFFTLGAAIGFALSALALALTVWRFGG